MHQTDQKENSYKQKAQNIKSFSTVKAHKNNADHLERRPALQMLNALNSKIEEQTKTVALKKEIKHLTEEAKNLKKANYELSKQLQIEKRLRKVWNNEQNIVFQDMQALKQQLSLLQQKYAQFN